VVVRVLPVGAALVGVAPAFQVARVARVCPDSLGRLVLAVQLEAAAEGRGHSSACDKALADSSTARCVARSVSLLRAGLP
jgi:hypothetical protein